MSKKRWITVRRPAWQSAAIRTTRYQSARRYSPFANEILRFLAVHRTATADQLQRALSSHFGADRTGRSVRMHLQTLASTGDVRVIRAQAVAGQNIYLITGRGLRKVADERIEVDARRRRSPSGSHLPHELLITEFAVLLRKTAGPESGIQIRWEERFGFQQYDCFRGLIPDYAFLVEHHEGLKAYFAEISSGEESSTRFRQKLEAYALWSETDEAQRFLVDLYQEHGARQPQPRFWLLCIVHQRFNHADDARLRKFVNAAIDVPPAIRRRCWCATAEAISTADNLAVVIWLRLGDLEPAFGEAQGLQGLQRRRRLAEAQIKLPRHCLFPTEVTP
jgi:hypothetical protein